MAGFRDGRIGEMPFVGRASEVDRIASHLNGNAAASVVLSGPAGVGKTRIATEFALRLERSGSRAVGLGASESMREVPFGCFAGLLGALGRGDPEARSSLSRAEMLAVAYESVRARLADAVLIVDDVHQLDPSSARLLGLLISSREHSCVMTARSDAALPDPIARLWMGGQIASIEVGPLPSKEIAAVCGATLGGTVEARTRLRLDEACAGNLLYLREILRSGVESGQLTDQNGLWCWEGRLSVSARLTELVGSRLLRATPDVNRLLRFVALAEPLPLDVLLTLCPPASLESAETSGFVLLQQDGKRHNVRLAHPMYGEVLRELGGQSEARRLASELAAALGRHGLRREQDVLRLAVLELRSGALRDPIRGVAAAARARDLGDLDLAIEIARTAADADGDPRARLELLECLFWQGRQEEALTIARRIDPRSLDVDDVVRLTVNVASVLFFGRGDLNGALVVLTDAEARIGVPAAVARLSAHRAELLMFSGDVVASEALGRGVLRSPAASVVTRAVAFGTVVPSLALMGRVEDSDRIAVEGLTFLLERPDPPLADGAGVVVGRFLNALFGCGYTETRTLIKTLHDEALQHPADPMLAVWSLMLGRVSISDGALPMAVEMLTAAAVQFRREDPSRLLSWALGSLAQALGMTGDGPAATRAVSEMEMVGDKHILAFGLDRDLGRAWASAADGRIEDARTIALAALEGAVERGAWGSGAYALFEAYRFGVPANTLAAAWPKRATVQGQLLPIALDTAIRPHSAAELLARASTFRSLDAHTWSIDATAIALRLARTDGDSATASRAMVWLDTSIVGPIRTPAVLDARSSDGTRLTRRERDIVRLVASGRTNSEIANELFVSKRTVESHLANLFKKLKITSRNELIR